MNVVDYRGVYPLTFGKKRVMGFMEEEYGFISWDFCYWWIQWAFYHDLLGL